MNTIYRKRIEQCNIASEYYLFSLFTFGDKCMITKKFKKQFFQILKNIGEINPDYIHVNPEESIAIDYKKFDLDIDVIMRKNIDDMDEVEMNAILHKIAGGAINLSPFYDSWTAYNRMIFMRDYENEYLATRRSLLICDVLL